MSKISNVKSGFTLVELLVVMMIIGVLFAILLVNFKGVKERTRDGQRKSDLRQIQSALELYRADQGAYPLTAVFPACGNPLAGGAGSSVITYMQKIPCDALDGILYEYSSTGGTTYSLVGCLENGNDAEIDKDASTGIKFNCTGGRSDRWRLTLTNP